MTLEKLIILDRDGVINWDSKAFIKSPEQWRPLPGSLEAIRLLTQTGYTIAVASNQSGVGRGLFDLATLAAIHEKMLSAVHEAEGKIAAIFYCPHAPEAGCDCRKPKIGLFKQIEQYFQVDLTHVLAVGDSLRDLQAASLAACQPVLVKTGNGQQTLTSKELPKNYFVYEDLLDFAKQLCR